jgi:hypothetical protein
MSNNRHRLSQPQLCRRTELLAAVSKPGRTGAGLRGRQDLPLNYAEDRSFSGAPHARRVFKTVSLVASIGVCHRRRRRAIHDFSGVSLQTHLPSRVTRLGRPQN